jgi:hypothetical protein
MLIIEWYLHKAEQCESKAKEAADPRTRARYEEEQELWREFAEREAASINSILDLGSEITARRRIH